MKSSYLNRYNIVQTFKDNEFQKIFIGTDNRNNDSVVINTIYTDEGSSFWDSIKENYNSFFYNIIDFEKLENEIVIVTKINEGIALTLYLNDFVPSFTERITLIHQYLKSIKKYEFLPNNIKSVLVDESQIVINESILSLDELIIFNAHSFNIEKFDPVMDNIISILKKLTSIKDINYEDLPMYVKVMEFIDKLQKNKSHYSSLEGLLTEFEALNIKSYAITNNNADKIQPDPTNLVGRKVGSINELDFEETTINKKSISKIALSTTGIIAISVAGVFAFKTIFPIDQNPLLGSNLAANDTVNLKLDVDKETEDTVDYDNKENENSNSKIVTPNDDISYLSEYIEQDFNNSKYADYSLKLSDTYSNSHKISINKDSIKSNSEILMWMKSDMTNEISINVEGYSKDNLVFQKSMTHTPFKRNTWELIQISIDKPVEDNIDIVFDNIKNTVWIDKIRIDLLK